MKTVDILTVIGAAGKLEKVRQWEDGGQLFTLYKKNGIEFIVRL